MRRGILLLFVALLAAGLAGCPPPSDSGGGESGGGSPGGGGGAPTGGNTSAGGGSGGSIKFGVYGDLTGDTATFGQSMKKGVELAVDEINRKPPLGRTVEVLMEDDAGKPQQATSVVTKLLTEGQVHAVIGEVASTNSLAAAPKCQAASIPMVTPASTNPQVTEVGDYIFRICFIDPFQGSVMAKFAINTLKKKRAAILFDQNSDYSKGLSKFFRDTYTQSGGHIVSEKAYSKGDTDFNGQLNAIKTANPDVLFVPGYYTEVGTIARQARDLGITAPLLGGDGWDSPKLFEGAGDKLEGCYFSNHYSSESKDERIVKFIDAFKQKYNGEIPDAMAALAYDTAMILADAVQRAGGTEGAKLRDAIAATRDFAGVTGKITLDQDRNATKPAVVLQITGEKFKYVETVQP
ncbi:MAG: ABC transporter substrate-binding protein [Armatimonadetes bacterium]|nr:ABC transporter substrate-binding protein [Armatimonadota bacterium]